MNFIKVILVIFALIILCACKNVVIKNDDYKKMPSVSVQQVKNTSYKVFSGLVKSQLISDLSFQSDGRIIFIPYTKGDFVKKGQVLARLDGVLYKIKKDEEQARLKNAIIQYNKSKSNFKRMDVLHKEGAISDNEWEDAFFDLKSYKEQIDIQKEKINYINKEISYNIILAPYDGYVVEKLAEIGTYTKIGEPVITISGSNQTQIEAIVDSSLVNKINVNESVVTSYDQNTYNGKIVHISRNSTIDGGFLIKILLDGPLVAQLKDGMNVDVMIPFKAQGIIYAPLDSVFEEDNQKYVYKVINIKNNHGQLKKQKVLTGQIQNEKIEILNGLENNDYIVSQYIDKNMDNAKIEL